jgi:hypothetical protein
VFERQTAGEDSGSRNSTVVRGDNHRSQMIDNQTSDFLGFARRSIVGRLDKLIVQRRQKMATGRFDEQDWYDRKTLQLAV